MIRTAMIIGCILFAGGGNLLLKAGMSHVGSVAETQLPVAAYILQPELPIWFLGTVKIPHPTQEFLSGSGIHLQNVSLGPS